MRNNRYNSIKKYSPVTPSLRHRVITEKPLKKRTIKKQRIKVKNVSGRNNSGRIRTRHLGGRHKRQLRKLDFLRKYGKYSESINLTVEYDPNRTSFIARYRTKKMKMFYITAPLDVSKIIVGSHYPKYKNLNSGNMMKLRDIPVGSKIHNIQLRKGEEPKLTRSAGTYSQLVTKTDKNAIIRLSSKKLLEVELDNKATLGQVSHDNHKLVSKGKAGANRWLGKRPRVRGYAMNPIDHPHGGKTKGGKQPLTKWGKQAKWIKKRINK